MACLPVDTLICQIKSGAVVVPQYKGEHRVLHEISITAACQLVQVHQVVIVGDLSLKPGLLHCLQVLHRDNIWQLQLATQDIVQLISILQTLTVSSLVKNCHIPFSVCGGILKGSMISQMFRLKIFMKLNDDPMNKKKLSLFSA